MAFAKVEELSIFDTLYSAKRRAVLPKMALPTPMVSLAVEPRSRGDEQKIGSALAKLADEDPAFVISRDQQTGETVVTGMSSLHVEIMLARMKERFQVEVNTKQPTIPYQETVTDHFRLTYSAAYHNINPHHLVILEQPRNGVAALLIDNNPCFTDDLIHLDVDLLEIGRETIIDCQYSNP